MWLLTCSGWAADGISPGTTAPDRDSPVAQVCGNTWHSSRRTWAPTLCDPLLIHGDAWGLSLAQGNYTNRINFGWKWQSRVVSYAFSNDVIRNTQRGVGGGGRGGTPQITLFLLFFMSLAPLCLCALGEYNIFLNTCPCCPAACH